MSKVPNHNLKGNLFWNILLNLSGYLFSLLTFPYVTRILDVEKLGIVNFALSIVDYAILFSTLGIPAIGIIYISKNGNDKVKRSNVFSGIISIHLILSLIVLCIYLIFVYSLPQLYEHKELYWIGAAKILLNVFLVEWLFQGMQNFRYITLRTLCIRFMYILAIYLWVKTNKDFDNYFYITVGMVIVNALINWKYARNYIQFSFSLKRSKEFLSPIVSMGVDKIFLSFYATFNVMFLGFWCGNASVGYYTTATKLYTLFISVIIAYNGAFVPYLASLYSEQKMEQFRKVVSQSIELISLVAIPVIVIGIVLAPHIIWLVAGEGYDRAVMPFRIILVQIWIVGLTQILKDQILMAFEKYRQILIITASTSFMSLLIILLYVPAYAEVAASYAVAIPHVFEIILFYIFAKRCVDISLPYQKIFINLIVCVPIVVLCMLVQHIISNNIFVLLTTLIPSFIYLLFIQVLVLKNKLILGQLSKLHNLMQSK